MKQLQVCPCCGVAGGACLRVAERAIDLAPVPDKDLTSAGRLTSTNPRVSIAARKVLYAEDHKGHFMQLIPGLLHFTWHGRYSSGTEFIVPLRCY